MFRLMVADVDSPTYFVATAAASLGFRVTTANLRHTRTAKKGKA